MVVWGTFGQDTELSKCTNQFGFKVYVYSKGFRRSNLNVSLMLGKQIIFHRYAHLTGVRVNKRLSLPLPLVLFLLII